MNKFIGGVALAALACACGAAAPADPPPHKLVILGIEGLDPELTARWMKAGKLPNVAKLAAAGGLYRLAPAATDVWASTFWIAADRAGVRSSILAVPRTLPPATLANGEMLSGSVPDVRGTAGTYHYFASDLPPKPQSPTTRGGVLKRLVFIRNVAATEIEGPQNPEAAEYILRTPLTVTWNHEARTANIAIAGDTIHLAEKQWSKWVPIDYEASRSLTIHGMAQFFLNDAGQTLQLYVSPIHWHPSRPPQPMASPPRFSADLFERLGPYRTLHHAEATAAFADRRLDAETFMGDLERAFDDRAATILHRVDAGRWQLLVGVIESADRLGGVSEAAIERVYVAADHFVGEVVQRLPAGTAVLVLSHHGQDDASPGVLITNRPPASTAPRIVDIAPTVLKYFGLPIPKETDGKPLF